MYILYRLSPSLKEYPMYFQHHVPGHPTISMNLTSKSTFQATEPREREGIESC